MTPPDQNTTSPTNDAASARAAALEEALTVLVNGTPHTTTRSVLDALVAELGHGGARVATAVNGAFVAADARAAHALREGDEIEIVTARQGG